MRCLNDAPIPTAPEGCWGAPPGGFYKCPKHPELTPGPGVPGLVTEEPPQPVSSPAGTELMAPMGVLSAQEKTSQKKCYFQALVQMGRLNK